MKKDCTACSQHTAHTVSISHDCKQPADTFVGVAAAGCPDATTSPSKFKSGWDSTDVHVFSAPPSVF